MCLRRFPIPAERIIYGDEGWRGLKGFFAWLETKKYKLHVRVFLAKFRGYTVCPDCEGGRLRQEARDVKVGGMSLPEIVNMSISDAYAFFETLKLDEEREHMREKLLLETAGVSISVGSASITYARRLESTLSGGEAAHPLPRISVPAGRHAVVVDEPQHRPAPSR